MLTVMGGRVEKRIAGDCELVHGLAMVWACLELFWFLVLRPWLWLKEMVL